MPDTLVIAEKPSVARDIARVLGATAQGPGCLRGNGYVVSWAIGHLVALPEPHEITPEWKAWRVERLPMLPERWPLKVLENTSDQFGVLKKLLKDCGDVVCATDAGREGELIFRYIYEAAACRKPVQRLWISSLTPDAIRAGFKALKPGASYDSLADAARARSRADWLVGMNLSRAYALTYGDRFFVGRVQTPTLALVVGRDREIADFKPEDYLEIEARFAHDGVKYPGFYVGELPAARNVPKAKRLPPDGKLAEEIIARAKAAPARVESLEGKQLRTPPPLLYDLTELQRHANRLFGFSASRTLEIAQALYERHKLISYPRTDSAHLSQSVAATLKDIVAAIRGNYSDLRPETGESPLPPRYVDDSKVTDHHAIIPTNVRPHHAGLNADEKKIYDLVCRRLLQLWQGDYVTAVTTLLTAAGNDLFRTQGTLVVEPGWKKLDMGEGKVAGDASGPKLPKLEKGMSVATDEVKPVKKTTRPPPPLTDSSLLAAMESAGKQLEDRELAMAMRDSGLGTPATRAATIETLLKRGYLLRDGQTLRASELGFRLIATVHESVKSPELTGRWEKELGRIQKGQRSFADFMSALEAEIRERVAEVTSRKPTPPSTPQSAPPPAPRRASPAPPVAPTVSRVQRGGDVREILKKTFGFDKFRPNQEAVCNAVVAGKDVLLVMPTGAGKSLCYQLPGLARGGTTLVVSPLVALIDDQVEKLKLLGLRAERIHSGRPREESRAVCHQYLAGELDFLFIAPERLAVPGFPELLRRGKLSLIAIDEAHCISHWGHDFRPEYRLLGERLGSFRPTPVIAVTATATPLVQEDIGQQLGLRNLVRSIHGFRRTNIAIELAEMNPGARSAAIVKLLKKADRLPAIVYAPTRKAAEALAEDLQKHFRAEAYHAGMAAKARDRVQENYLRGDLEVIVATIAFGMGIDKANVRTVIHAALPGSVEGYYQEIGRAGRDGKLSRAVLFHSFIDRKTHEFFFEKSYPDAVELMKIFTVLGPRPLAKADVRNLVRMNDETFERGLEKLWIHKGAIVDPEENVTRGDIGWTKPYAAQREHRLLQLRQITALTDSPRCRMHYLVSHFGDEQDGGAPCGICDACAPGAAEASLPSRNVNEGEQRTAAKIMQAVAARGGYAVGRLHQDIAKDEARREFENLVGALAREGWLRVAEETFSKGGQTIPFRKLFLTEAGRKATAEQLAKLQVRGAVEEEKRGKRVRRTRKTKRRRETTARVSSGSNLFEALREWRLAEAKKKRVPAFRIMTDAVLKNLCAETPVTEEDLHEVGGFGPAMISRYGSAVLRIVADHAG